MGKLAKIVGLLLVVLVAAVIAFAMVGNYPAPEGRIVTPIEIGDS